MQHVCFNFWYFMQYNIFKYHSPRNYLLIIITSFPQISFLRFHCQIQPPLPYSHESRSPPSPVVVQTRTIKPSTHWHPHRLLPATITSCCSATTPLSCLLYLTITRHSHDLTAWHSARVKWTGQTKSRQAPVRLSVQAACHMSGHTLPPHTRLHHLRTREQETEEILYIVVLRVRKWGSWECGSAWHPQISPKCSKKTPIFRLKTLMIWFQLFRGCLG
jgi:hypothetical protein